MAISYSDLLKYLLYHLYLLAFMCAGITFYLDKINPSDLDRFFTPAEFAKQRKGDVVQTFFWQEHPFLPVAEADGVKLYPWGLPAQAGNREAGLKLPKTGWAKLESVQDGRWDWLAPKAVTIPSVMGYEKKKWFRTPDGVKGIKVRFHNTTRVYLLTAKATQVFLEYTGHDRMPVGKIVYMK